MKYDKQVGTPTFAAPQSLKGKKYWMDKLAGELEKTGFPCDHRTKRGKPILESVNFELTGEIFSNLMKLRNGSDHRMIMILVAGLSVLLEKYTGNNDIILGMPVERQKTEGQFINRILVLRNFLENHITFKELLLQVRQTVVEAVENQNYPIETLLDDLGFEANGSADEFPLFDIAVVLENIHDKAYFEHIDTRMIFSFLRTDRCVNGVLEFDSSLYNPGTIEQIIAHLIRVLGQVLKNVNHRLSEIDIMSEQEKKQILYDFNRTETDYPGHKPLQQLFEEQVETAPSRIAVIFQDQYLTYNELNRRANRLAYVLRLRGVMADKLVGIMLRSSLEMVTGILGILKAGGAYLPIGFDFPENRINIILKDSQPDILVNDGDRRLKDLVSTLIDISDTSMYPDDHTNPDMINKPFHAAYVIFTSGTTGRPKGVMVEHRSVVNTLVCRKEEYGMNPAITSLQLFSFTFDGFVTSFFTPVLSGGKIILLSEDGMKDINRIKNAVVSHKVNHFIAVPSLYQAIIESLTPEEASHLKVVTLAGDRLTPELLGISRGKKPGLEIVNEFGITEAAVMSTLHRHQERENRVKIGKPVWNTAIYITDDQDRLQPIGVVGELCISGAGVARGYLNKPELTAQKFQFPGEHMADIYKTGDLARWLPDGNIELLGRQDFQVKIRGYRIELGEIENQLRRNDQIKDAVVLAKENNKNEKYLCAFIVKHIDVNVDISVLRAYLAEGLPVYMIPAHFVEVDQIPLTANGKVDTKSLLQHKDVIAEIEYAEPRNEIEKKLVRIWSKLLDIDRIGIKDNFFNIGGDSIKSINLMNSINKAFDRQFELADIYENETIEKIAGKIQESDIVDISENYKSSLEKMEEMKSKFLREI